MEPKNIAILNTVFDRSTGKIATGLLNYLIKNGYSAVLCYGRGSKKEDNTHYRIDYPVEFLMHALLCRITGFQGAYSYFATKRLIKKLKGLKIDTIYGISLHGYYLNERLLWKYINENDIKFIYVMIDEYPFRGKCGYSGDCKNYLNGCGNCPRIKEYPKSLFFDKTAKMYEIKKEAYAKLKHTIFVGPEYTIKAGIQSPLLTGIKTEVIDEAIDLNLYYPRNVGGLQEKLHINSNKIIILCIAPFSSERKGCKYFLQLAERMREDDRYVFVHVGYDGDTSLCPSNYIPIGYESDQDKLAQYYSLADLFVFPSLLDTMPNACLEALACGSPLLCFNISGMPYIANAETAIFVEPKNVDQMMEVVKKTGKKSQEIIDRCRDYAKKRYDNQMYFEKLLECGKKI